MSEYNSAADILKFYNTNSNFDFEYQSLDFVKFDDNKIKFDEDYRWRNRGYTHGQGLLSPCEKYFYLKIPKNGSSFAATNLERIGWQHKQLNECDSPKVIAILRDPIDRWISGVVEYLFMYHMEELTNISFPWEYEYSALYGERLGLSLLFNQLTFDDHTERQAMFFRNIDLQQVSYVFLDSNFNKNFSQLIHDCGYPNDFETAEKINSSDTSDENMPMYKQSLKTTLKTIIERSPYKKYNLKQWHWCDYELIRLAKEYSNQV